MAAAASYYLSQENVQNQTLYTLQFYFEIKCSLTYLHFLVEFAQYSISCL